MRLVTFNMRGGGSRAHWETLLGETTPAIAFVQETRDPRLLPSDLLAVHDLTNACWSQAGHGKWGSALWLREGACETMALSGPTWWAAGGTVRAMGEEIFACSVHLAPAAAGAYVRSANTFLDGLRSVAGSGPVVLGGDWNLSVGARQPDEELRNSRGERELLQRMREEFGLVSAWSACYPTLPLPQTLRRSTNPVRPYHCDGVFVPVSWGDRLRSVEVPAGPAWTALSDHNPVVVEVDALPPLDRVSSSDRVGENGNGRIRPAAQSRMPQL